MRTASQPSTAATSSLRARQQACEQLEREATAREAALAEAATTLRASVDEAAARLQRVRAACAAGQLVGARGERMAKLHQRLLQAALPEPDAAALLEPSLHARESAARARERALQDADEKLQLQRAELSCRMAQLAADEAALEVLLASHTEQTAQPQRVERPPAEEAPAPARPHVSAEERAHPRVSVQEPVDLHSETNFFTGFSADISEGGLFVATLNEVPIGTEVDLSFTLEGMPVHLRGVVRWTRELNELNPGLMPGLGIQFLALPTDTLGQLRRFTEEREPLFFPD